MILLNVWTAINICIAVPVLYTFLLLSTCFIHTSSSSEFNKYTSTSDTEFLSE